MGKFTLKNCLFLIWIFMHCTLNITKLRTEMGNVSNRQQHDQRAENTPRPPMGLQQSPYIRYQFL